MSIQQLLEIALQRSASDLHLLVGFEPMIRISGELVPIEGSTPLSIAEVSALLLPLLTPYQKDYYDKNLELDFSFGFENRVRFRVNIYRQQGQLAAALRLIPIQIPAIESLGLPPVVTRLIELRQGLVLVTGPTGHGKSTTLASMLNRINEKHPAHIITIEDPIEYVYPKLKALISQREMFLDSKSWAAALKSALREDPDVVMVGEMRDLDTIAAAITIAETGHLVFATLHTNSASQAIDRIIDVFPENQQPQIRSQLAATLEGVISQRLVPTIQPGRKLAVELLLRNAALGSVIRDGKTHLIDNLIQTSAEYGMISLEGSLSQLVKAGVITLETGLSYALRPEVLSKLV